MTKNTPNLFPNHPTFLMSDLRTSHPDYLNDQVWSLSFGTTSVKAILLETTYGLRVNWMRIFPRFHEGNKVVVDPNDFAGSVVLKKRYANYLEISFLPFEGLEATIEIWVPNSQCIAGRYKFKNTMNDSRKISLELVGMLNPLEGGSGLIPINKNSSHILQGRAGSLAPVIFLGGGPVHGTGSLTSLELSLKLESGVTNSCVWATASLSNSDASYNHAKSLCAANLDSEFARIERYNEWNRVDINTGNASWDYQIDLTQKYVDGLFFPSSPHLPRASIVLSRTPDTGYSYKGDGTDYPSSWSGQSLIDSYFLSGIIPPNNYGLIKGLVENFIFVQEDSGSIDAHPGLAGQRIKSIAPPLLATLAAKIYSYDQDKSWLEKIYPALIHFLQCWLTRNYDKDGDGLPEWQTIYQAGLENHPILDPWCQDSKAIDIKYLESPALAAFLLQDFKNILRICKEINDQTYLSYIGEKIKFFENIIKEFWSEKNLTFQYRDFQDHEQKTGSTILKFSGPGTYKISDLKNMVKRLHFIIRNINENTRTLLVTISGEDTLGNPIVEKATARDFTWILTKALYTSKKVYSSIRQITLACLQTDLQGEVFSIDTTFEDISLLLPIWANALPVSIKHDDYFEKIKQKYLTDQGLASFPVQNPHIPNQSIDINPFWNVLIMEGLLNCGNRELAAEILVNYLNSLDPGNIVQIPSHWGYGLPKLVPIELFLRIIGIRKLTHKYIILEGYSPFRDPVTVKYEGISILIKEKEYLLTTPTGETMMIVGPGTHQVELK